MGRKKKEDSENSNLNIFKNLKEETIQGVLAVVFFVFGLFFLLASFDKAGPIGRSAYRIFKLLFGYGYFLIPLVFFMLCVSFFQTLKRSFAGTQTVGGFLFVVSSLGIINLLKVDGGGVVGGLISHPLTSLFDVYATSIILIALLVISFLLIFDTALKLDFLFAIKNLFQKKKKEQESNAEVEIKLPKGAEVQEDDEEVENEEPKENVVKKMFQKREPLEEEFIQVKPRTFTLKPFTPPPLSLLEKDRGKPGVGDIRANANLIKRTLQNFGIAVEMDEISIGPSVTRYALKPAEGVKLSRILGLQNNLELALAAHPVRIEAPIPGKSLVGIEIPNTTKTTVGLGSLLAESEFERSDKPLLVSLGKGISGLSHFGNVAKMPHMLIAGATGSGKSVTIHAIIASLLFRNPPDSLKFIMIDPKRVELTLYNSIPHLLTHERDQTTYSFHLLEPSIETRICLFARLSFGTRNTLTGAKFFIPIRTM
jgi:S-DNA-T family DNA segregation ATPase FtsK/SpoIIIE